MPSLPEPPAAQRSWLARGQFSPAPWARTGHAILYESDLTFYRMGTLGEDSHGGFKGAARTDYLRVMGHVELEATSAILPGALAPITVRHYLVIIDVPTDTAQIPVKGDRVSFTDGLGGAVDLGLDQVDMPEGVADHLEIATAEFT